MLWKSLGRTVDSAADQDRLISILQASARPDPRPLCRLAAVDALSRFKDPRVGPILITAYQNAPFDTPPAAGADAVAPAGLNSLKTAVSQFTPDTVTTLQCRALESLGRHRNAEGLRLLVQVASAPTEQKPKTSGVEAAGALVSLGASMSRSESDRVDVPHFGAIRALGSYENDPTAIQALIGVLKVEKDVAVRGRADESLVKATGKDLPPDGQAWARWLETGAKR